MEVPFTLPLVDHNTGEPTGRYYSGIVDAVLEDSDGDLWFVDHKTAKSVDWSYWQELKTNAQASQYLFAGFQMHAEGRIPKEPKGVLWDVIQKPGIEPKKLTKVMIAELEAGDCCGMPFKAGYNGEDFETPRMYGQRVFVKYTEEPDKHFHRRKFFRTAEQHLRYLRKLNRVAAGMEELKRDPTDAIPSEGACKQFNRLCEYHQICAMDDPDKEQYHSRPEKSEGSVRTCSGSLSPSRVQCYQSCQQKYVYRYVEKIEPKKLEYASELHFGTLVHAAIENWLLANMKDPLVFPNEGGE